MYKCIVFNYSKFKTIKVNLLYSSSLHKTLKVFRTVNAQIKFLNHPKWWLYGQHSSAYRILDWQLFKKLEYAIPPPLASVVFDEKSMHKLFGIPSWISCFSLVFKIFFVINFQCRLICLDMNLKIYLIGDLLSFMDVKINVFHICKLSLNNDYIMWLKKKKKASRGLDFYVTM